ncbi:uncharacterized protein LOC121739099 [Aricia agestis]|uniref:uncharacterized protein LOC121739099 n=1 Tax=Aricia agestis TaxID=91739 RepID=UPI001C20A3F0|nr:uncharacterized protein LOC121739099 [Aricia agestis]
MKILVCFGVILLSFTVSSEEAQNSTETLPSITPEPVIERSSHHHHESPPFQGFWKKRFVWRPRWVKTWQEKKIYVAVWKKMWGPAELKEWVPVPKPPPGWVRHGGVPFIKLGVPH